jgi:hypothetical protein
MVILRDPRGGVALTADAGLVRVLAGSDQPRANRYARTCEARARRPVERPRRSTRTRAQREVKA